MYRQEQTTLSESNTPVKYVKLSHEPIKARRDAASIRVAEPLHNNRYGVPVLDTDAFSEIRR